MPLSLDTDVIGIGNLLKQGTFMVPEHQRSYAWEDAEVTDLWRDVRLAMDEEPEGYFLGQVVLGASSEQSQRSTVIDGQQRLATVSLLYAAMAAVFRARDTDGGDIERAAELDRDFLASKDKETLERTSYLQLGPNDTSTSRTSSTGQRLEKEPVPNQPASLTNGSIQPTTTSTNGSATSPKRPTPPGERPSYGSRITCRRR
jgi:uncharacterized protein with ParB-like and HNH nuclease domain